MRFLIVLVLTAFFCAVGLMAAMGLVPLLSDFLGAGKADLGIQYASSDILELRHSYEKYLAGVKRPDIGMTSAPTDSGQSKELKPDLTDTARHQAMSISNAQLSALLNSDKFTVLPMRDIQAKSGTGTIELSGILAADRLGPFLKSVGAKAKLSEELQSRLSDLDGAPLYLKLDGGVENGSMNLKVQTVKVGLVSLPDALMAGVADRGIHANLMNQSGFSIQSLQFGEGGVRFDGVVPPDWQPEVP